MTTFTPTSEDTRVYELCVLYPHPLSQKEEQDLLKEIEALFTEAGATQLHKDLWGRRGLAYKINVYEQGSYVLYYY